MKKPIPYSHRGGKNNLGRHKNPDGLKKSFFDKDGFRYRVLRRKEKDRWEYLELPQNDWMKNVNHICYIYTLEQALELNINFRENWKDPKPNTDKQYFNTYTYCQKDDWVLCDHVGPLDEYWVMQVLWRNESGFPHIRTGTGTYVFDATGKKKPFDAWDYENDWKAGTSRIYDNNNIPLNYRQKLLIQFIASNIKENGYYSFELVKVSYMQAYGAPNVSFKRVIDVMRSEKIMNAVAKELKDILKDEGADLTFVVKNLMDMAGDGREKVQQTRFDVLKLIGAMNNAPMYELSGEGSSNGKIQELKQPEIEDAKANNDLRKLGIG